jgi:hypothetical protein
VSEKPAWAMSEENKTIMRTCGGRDRRLLAESRQGAPGKIAARFD